MHQGNWKCSGCGGEIKELPFQPRSETGLTCRDCWSKNNNKSAAPATADVSAPPSEEMPFDIPEDAGVASGPMPDDDGMDAKPVVPGEKAKFEGDWRCAGCGGSITSLPFQPRDTSNLKCLDCFKASKK
jgi:CxxC-x17-CxxC domain-containing protein